MLRRRFSSYWIVPTIALTVTYLSLCAQLFLDTWQDVRAVWGWFSSDGYPLFVTLAWVWPGWYRRRR